VQLHALAGAITRDWVSPQVSPRRS
jgi:hypothetical protein